MCDSDQIGFLHRGEAARLIAEAEYQDRLAEAAERAGDDTDAYACRQAATQLRRRLRRLMIERGDET